MELFQQNLTKFLQLESIGESRKEAVLDDILEKLHQFSNKLFFQISVGNGDNEFIISADGNIDYFEKVEELVDAAPKLENWKIIAFKPRQNLDFQISYEDIRIDPKEVWFTPLVNSSNQNEFGVKLFFRNFSNKHKNKFLQASFQILDTILGEKDATLNIHHVEVDNLPSDPASQRLMALENLPAFLDWKKVKKN